MANLRRFWIFHVLHILFRCAEFPSLTLADEYCEDDPFIADCGSRAVVVMETARYGRMVVNRCLSKAYELGCFEDVKYLLDRRCSGLHRCEVKVHGLVEVSKPCGPDLRSYLEATYTCLDVTLPSVNECNIGQPVVISDTGSGSVSGALSSLITQATSCGSVESPWTIHPSPGRNVRVTMVDFSIPGDGDLAGRRPQVRGNPEICTVLAVVREDVTSGSTKTICRGAASPEKREQVIYDGSQSPSSPDIEVRFMKPSMSEDGGTTNFLLTYTISGCSDPPVTLSTTLERTRDGAVILCGGLIKWTIRCVDNTWEGDWKNCSGSAGHSVAASKDGTTGGGTVINAMFGLPGSTIITAVVVIAVLIGAAVLLVGICCVQKRTNSFNDPAKLSSARHLPAPPPPTYDESMYYSGGTHKDPYRQLTQERELQQHHTRPHVHHAPYHHAGSASRTGSSSAYGGDERYVEHIYESPKFSRRDLHGAHKHDIQRPNSDIIEYPFIPDVLVAMPKCTDIN